LHGWQAIYYVISQKNRLHIAKAALTMRNMSNPNTKITAQVIRRIGGAKAVGRLLGITSQAVSQWQDIPAIHVIRLSRASGIEPHRIRPDYYPRPPRQPK